MYEIWQIAAPIVWSLVEVVAVFLIGTKLIKLVIEILKKATERAGLEKGVISFLSSMARIALYGILVVIIAGIFGIPTASFVAVIGSCGLAVGLALQGSLQNFAGGVLILLMKPFVVGDYISAKGLEGTVYSIDICYTKLKTPDNKIVVLPNGALSNADLVNVSKEPVRRVDFTVPVSYSDDYEGIKSMLAGLAASSELVLKDRPVDIFISDFANDSVSVGFRVWCATEHYWDVKFDLQEKIKKSMDEKGYTIPFRQVDVLIKNEK